REPVRRRFRQVENVKRWLPLLLWAALVFAVSSLHGSSFPKSVLFDYDKLLHGAEYAAGGLLAALAPGAPTWQLAFLAAALVALYGASDELHQLFVPGRSCDVRDWIADAAGGTLGAVLWRIRTR